jgi:hypothetical protein
MSIIRNHLDFLNPAAKDWRGLNAITLGLTPGVQVVIEADGGGVRLRNWNRVLAEVQDFFRDVGPPGAILSEELIADRRAEAAREEDE